MENVEDFRAFVEILRGPLLWPCIWSAIVLFVMAILKGEYPFWSVLSLFTGYVLFFYSIKYGIATNFLSPELAKVVGVGVALALSFLSIRLSFGALEGVRLPEVKPTNVSSYSSASTSVSGGDADAGPGDYGAPGGDGAGD